MPNRITLAGDSNFFIGDQHLRQGKPCQDYTLTERVGDFVLAIVCDGCSTGLKTDVGARLWALATFAAVRSILKEDPRVALNDTLTRNIEESRWAIVNQSKKIYGLQFKDLLATCGYGLFSSTGGIVHLVGDGVVIEKYRDGRVILSRYDWEKNTPAYPMYAEDFYVGFIKEHGGNINVPRLKCTTVSLFSEEKKDIVTEEIPLGVGMVGVTRLYDEHMMRELECVCISTDGITQIRMLHEGEMADWVWAAGELVRLKNSTGEFMKRRTRGFLQDIGKTGKVPFDDLGCAAVSISVDESATEE